jgi:hypothetical protein
MSIDYDGRKKEKEGMWRRRSQQRRWVDVWVFGTPNLLEHGGSLRRQAWVDVLAGIGHVLRQQRRGDDVEVLPTVQPQSFPKSTLACDEQLRAGNGGEKCRFECSSRRK